MASGDRALEIESRLWFQIDRESLRPRTGSTPEHLRVKSENHHCPNSLLVSAFHGDCIQSPTHHHTAQRSLTMLLPVSSQADCLKKYLCCEVNMVPACSTENTVKSLKLWDTLVIFRNHTGPLVGDECAKLAGRLEREQTKRRKNMITNQLFLCSHEIEKQKPSANQLGSFIQCQICGLRLLHGSRERQRKDLLSASCRQLSNAECSHNSWTREAVQNFIRDWRHEPQPPTIQLRPFVPGGDGKSILLSRACSSHSECSVRAVHGSSRSITGEYESCRGHAAGSRANRWCSDLGAGLGSEHPQSIDASCVKSEPPLSPLPDRLLRSHHDRQPSRELQSHLADEDFNDDHEVTVPTDQFEKSWRAG